MSLKLVRASFPRLRSNWRLCVVFILSAELFLTTPINTAELHKPRITVKVGAAVRSVRRKDVLIMDFVDADN